MIKDNLWGHCNDVQFQVLSMQIQGWPVPLTRLLLQGTTSCRAGSQCTMLDEQDLDPGVPCSNEQDPCVEGDLLLVGVIDLIWDSITFPAFDQQVEKSVPCIIISICTVAQLVLYLCMTSELSFTC